MTYQESYDAISARHEFETEFIDNADRDLMMHVAYSFIGAWGHFTVCDVLVKMPKEALFAKSDVEWEAWRTIREDIKKEYAYYAKWDDVSFECDVQIETI